MDLVGFRLGAFARAHLEQRLLRIFGDIELPAKEVVLLDGSDMLKRHGRSARVSLGNGRACQLDADLLLSSLVSLIRGSGESDVIHIGRLPK